MVYVKSRGPEMRVQASWVDRRHGWTLTLLSSQPIVAHCLMLRPQATMRAGALDPATPKATNPRTGIAATVFVSRGSQTPIFTFACIVGAERRVKV